MLRDALRREVPVVLRHELHAIPALARATLLVVAREAGGDSGAYAILGAAVCLAIRLVAVRASSRASSPPTPGCSTPTTRSSWR